MRYFKNDLTGALLNENEYKDLLKKESKEYGLSVEELQESDQDFYECDKDGNKIEY